MLAVFLAALVVCVLAELIEGGKIWNTEDYAHAVRRLTEARRRLAEAESKVAEKGAKKVDRLRQARAALVDAERRRNALARSSRGWFTSARVLGALVVRSVYGDAPGMSLPFGLPERARFVFGTGGDARDLNAVTAFLLMTFSLRAVFGDFLDRRARVVETYFGKKDADKYMAASRELLRRAGKK